MLKKWDDIPDFMRVDEVEPYWEVLYAKRGQLLVKRLFDIIFAGIMMLLLFIPMAFIAILIKIDSKGPVFYRQDRVTTYGKKFKIHKFRTMCDGADRIGYAVTTNGDSRITKIGVVLRKYRLDEFPQLIDVLVGNMSFIGTRPEVVKYVKCYNNEMLATLLLPAGITSEASLAYKDEMALLDASSDVDKTYIECILPKKMKYNLQSIKEFSIFREAWLLLKTVKTVFLN